MNLYSHGFQGPKYPVAKKCDTLSMLLGSIIVTDENKQLFWDPRYQYMEVR